MEQIEQLRYTQTYPFVVPFLAELWKQLPRDPLLQRSSCWSERGVTVSHYWTKSQVSTAWWCIFVTPIINFSSNSEARVTSAVTSEFILGVAWFWSRSPAMLDSRSEFIFHSHRLQCNDCTIFIVRRYMKGSRCGCPKLCHPAVRKCTRPPRHTEILHGGLAGTRRQQT